MPTVLKSYTLRGLDVVPVDVEIQVSSGMPNFRIIGMAGKSIVEAADRVRGAMVNSGFKFDLNRKVVNLAPAELWKHGTHFDLPMAVGILQLTGQLPEMKGERLFIGELGLEGGVKEIRGILPAVMWAKEQGFKEVIIPEANVNELWGFEGVDLIAVKSLRDVVEHLCGEGRAPLRWQGVDVPVCVTWDMSEIAGHAAAKRALLVAAAGGHHLRMCGPPGTGKSMLARAFPSLLPPLTAQESLDVKRIYSISGANFKHNAGRPFRHVQHHCTPTQLLGGGQSLAPGEISLAHHGVLFLDELLEFKRDALERLRAPIESRRVQFRQGRRESEFPCSFQLLAAHNPCPCGYFGDAQQHCQCPEYKIASYRARLSGPMMDRIDIHIHVPRVPFESYLESPDSKHLQQLVLEARQRQLHRQGKGNHELEASELRALKLDTKCQQFLDQQMQARGLSGRRLHSLMKVARSIADLSGKDRVHHKHVVEASHYLPSR